MVVPPSRGGGLGAAVHRAGDAGARAAGYGRAVPRLRPIDWIPAAILGGLSLYEVWVGTIFSPGFQGPVATSLLVALLLTVALLLRRAMPLRAILLIVAAICVQSLTLEDPREVQVSFELFLAMILTAYAVVVHAERVRALQALVGLFAVHSITLALRPGEATQEETIGTFVVLLGLWVAGSAVRARQERIAELESARDREAREAVAGERARIARELHDIVAHAVSVMVVQIGGARHAMRSDPEVAEQSMRSAEAAGREALSEMRRLVGLMREDAPRIEPVPGVGALPALVRRFAGAGLPVTLDVDPALPEVGAGLDLTAYRVVQEGLTNALKHAGQVPTSVRVHRTGDRLHIQVRNAAGAATRNGQGGGHGLRGLAERVALYGGRMDAGQDAGAGFALRVELPL